MAAYRQALIDVVLEILDQVVIGVVGDYDKLCAIDAGQQRRKAGSGAQLKDGLVSEIDIFVLFKVFCDDDCGLPKMMALTATSE